jgi:spore germination cell wall hydrolase CwlJ-like protein
MLNEILCLSQVMFGEARGEPDIGKVAVAYTVINRKADPKYPKSICEIMKQPFQYQFINDYGIPSQTQVAYLMPLAEAILNGRVDDPTKGAKWFHTRKTKPFWAKQKDIKIALGNHIFY